MISGGFFDLVRCGGDGSLGMLGFGESLAFDHLDSVAAFRVHAFTMENVVVVLKA